MVRLELNEHEHITPRNTHERNYTTDKNRAELTSKDSMILTPMIPETDVCM